MSPPSSGSKNKPRKKAILCLLSLFFHPEELSRDYAALYPRRQNSSQPPL
jgi:hypothetical protein